MKKLCVFCGSGSGGNPLYLEMAKNLGKIMAENNLALVYGGASIGLMGALADAVLIHGGRVIGVLPQSLIEYEIAHKGLSELHIVEDMHQRKKLMYDKSDAFLTLPGGMGTLDETFEIITWRQLKLHSKPCFVYNYLGFYDSLLAFLNHSQQEGFIKKQDLLFLKEVKDERELKKMLEQI